MSQGFDVIEYEYTAIQMNGDDTPIRVIEEPMYIRNGLSLAPVVVVNIIDHKGKPYREVNLVAINIVSFWKDKSSYAKIKKGDNGKN